MSYWNCALATVIGSSHTKMNLPCQDSAHYTWSKDFSKFAVCISDGAGSSPKSSESAHLVATQFCDFLVACPNDTFLNTNFELLQTNIINKLNELREKIRNIDHTLPLKDFHCTLLALVCSSENRYVIHIGDGMAFGGKKADLENLGNDIDLNFVSNPENGEYANETYFLTEDSWLKNLRIQNIDDFDWAVLGSDGGIALATLNGGKPKAGFIQPIFEKLIVLDKQESKNNFLRGVLSDPRADRLTDDDKTLIFCWKGELNFHVATGVFSQKLAAEKKLKKENKNIKNYLNKLRLIIGSVFLK